MPRGRLSCRPKCSSDSDAPPWIGDLQSLLLKTAVFIGLRGILQFSPALPYAFTWACRRETWQSVDQALYRADELRSYTIVHLISHEG